MREVEPMMIRVVSNVINLAHSIRMSHVNLLLGFDVAGAQIAFYLKSSESGSGPSLFYRAFLILNREISMPALDPRYL
jgi:hypothetical protein